MFLFYEGLEALRGGRAGLEPTLPPMGSARNRMVNTVPFRSIPAFGRVSDQRISASRPEKRRRSCERLGRLREDLSNASGIDRTY